MADPHTLQSLVDAIPGPEGWYKPSTGSVFREAARQLVRIGMTREDAVKFLASLYSATASEYGD